ncbi:hypothetical protein [Dinoroseobacter sp. S375]|uniref:hypothetical protein n=1 Tax=Dinoroseobacter sp. S375 TaxID=3415136 RepID=UPI003C7DDACB
MSFAEYNTDATPESATPETKAQEIRAEAAEQISEMTERTKAQVDAGLQDLQRMSDELSTEVSRAVTSATEEGTRFVREHPGAALAGAVGLGVLVGLALRPRS